MYNKQFIVIHIIIFSKNVCRPYRWNVNKALQSKKLYYGLTIQIVSLL